MRVFDAGCADGRCYIAMEYLSYGTLRSRLAAIAAGGERMAVAEALEVARQIALALDHAHKRGLIHRDVKPSNIMLAAGGRTVLTDFGTAFVEAATKLTSPTGRVIGTAEYLSPEQANGQPLDHRVDIYALGVVLYEMLAGRVPFDGDNDLLVIYAHAHREPRPLAELRGDVPRDAAAIVARALHKQPAQRFASAGEMALALEGALGMLAGAAEAAPGACRNRQVRPMLLALACAAALAVAIALGAQASESPQAPSTTRPQGSPLLRLCDVALVITAANADIVGAPHARAPVALRAAHAQRIDVRGRSRDGDWLWVGADGATEPGWMRSRDGELDGRLECVPEVPSAEDDS